MKLTNLEKVHPNKQRQKVLVCFATNADVLEVSKAPQVAYIFFGDNDSL
jgi:hypothetical protein